MGQRIHTGVCGQFCRHCFRKVRVNNCDVRRNVKVSQRVFDPFRIVGDNGKCGNLSCRSGGRRDSQEFCFLAQGWEIKRNNQVFKGNIRIFIERPHCFCSVDRGASSDGNDPVRLELLHRFCALHNGFNRRIWFYAFKELYFHTSFLKIIHNLIQKAEALHGTAADNNDCFLALQIFQLI